MEENRIGQFIAELRKEKKLTQKDLAAQLNVTDKAVSKWEIFPLSDCRLLYPIGNLSFFCGRKIF